MAILAILANFVVYDAGWQHFLTMNKDFQMSSVVVSPSEWLNRPAAAKYIDLQPQTLACWAVSGKYNLPFFRVGNSVRYRKSDLDAWLESRRVGGEAAE